MDNLNAKKLFLYVFLASVTASALLGIAILIFGSFGELEIKVLLTAFTVTVTSILGLACGAFLETGRGRVVPITGIVLALISGVMWMFVIWPDGNREALFVRGLLSITILSATCSHLSLLLLARFEDRFSWVRISAYATVWPLSAVLVFLVWDSHLIGEQVTGRVTGVMSILVGAVTVMTPIFHWLSRAEPTVAGLDAEIAKLRARIEELEARKETLMATADAT